jgi:hypothetical protein
MCLKVVVGRLQIPAQLQLRPHLRTFKIFKLSIGGGEDLPPIRVRTACEGYFTLPDADGCVRKGMRWGKKSIFRVTRREGRRHKGKWKWQNVAERGHGPFTDQSRRLPSWNPISVLRVSLNTLWRAQGTMSKESKDKNTNDKQ